MRKIQYIDPKAFKTTGGDNIFHDTYDRTRMSDELTDIIIYVDKEKKQIKPQDNDVRKNKKEIEI